MCVCQRSVITYLSSEGQPLAAVVWAAPGTMSLLCMMCSWHGVGMSAQNEINQGPCEEDQAWAVTRAGP